MFLRLQELTCFALFIVICFQTAYRSNASGENVDNVKTQKLHKTLNFSKTAQVPEINLTTNSTLLEYCHFRYSCMDPSYPINCSNPVKTSSLCSCHPYCVIFKDCCYDAVEYNTICNRSVEVEPSIKKLIPYMQCINSNIVEFPTYYQIVSSCPNKWLNDDIERKCSVTQFTWYDGGLDKEIMVLPVIARKTVTFKNIFCAVCHSEKLQDLHFWDMNVTLVLIGINKTFKNYHSIEITPPSDTVYMNAVVECNYNMVKYLTNTCIENDLHKLNCESIYAPYFLRNKFYMNVFCAACSDIQHQTVYSQDSSCLFDGHSGNQIMGEDKIYSQRLGLFPLTVMVEFKGDRRSIKVIVDTKNVTCGYGYVFFPLQSRCIILYCADEFELHGNTCIYNGNGSSENYCTGYTLYLNIYSHQSIKIVECLHELFHLSKNSFVPVNFTYYPHYKTEIFQFLVNKTVDIEFMRQQLLDSAFGAGIKSKRVCTFVNKIEIHEMCNTYSEHKCDKQWIPKSGWTTERTDNSLDIIHVYEANSYVERSEVFFKSVFVRENETNQFHEENFSIKFCPTFNQSCSLVRMNLSFFEKGDNNILYFPTENITFDSSEYKYVSTNHVEICNILNKFGTKNDTTYFVFIKYEESQILISAIGSSITILALSFTLLTYFLFKSLRKSPSSLLIIMLCFNLLSAHLTFFFIRIATIITWFCTFIAIASHFFWLSVFFTSATLGLDINRTFGQRTIIPSKDEYKAKIIFRYFGFCYALPLSIIACTFLMMTLGAGNLSITYGSEEVCWVGDSRINILAFGVPVGICICLNFILFLHTICGICSVRKEIRILSRGDKTDHRTQLRDVFIFFKISTVLGLTWIFGLLVSIFDSRVLSYTFIILNSLQGLFILIAFTFNSRVYGLWKARLKIGYQKAPQNNNNVRMMTPTTRADVPIQKDTLFLKGKATEWTKMGTGTTTQSVTPV